jgi:hypothetical protein
MQSIQKNAINNAVCSTDFYITSIHYYPFKFPSGITRTRLHPESPTFTLPTIELKLLQESDQHTHNRNELQHQRFASRAADPLLQLNSKLHIHINSNSFRQHYIESFDQQRQRRRKKVTFWGCHHEDMLRNKSQNQP